MFGPQGTAALLAVHDEYIRKVNEALEHGRDDDAIALAGEFATEMGLVRVA